MKNISLIVGSNPTYYVPPPMPAAPAPPFSPNPSKLYNVSFSAQFEDEAAAILFASKLLAMTSGE